MPSLRSGITQSHNEPQINTSSDFPRLVGENFGASLCYDSRKNTWLRGGVIYEASIQDYSREKS